MNHVVDKSKIHIFVHFCILQHFASDAGTEKKIWLDIDIVASETFAFDQRIVEGIIHLFVLFYFNKLIEFFCRCFGCEGMQLFESDCFEAWTIGFLCVKDQSNLWF